MGALVRSAGDRRDRPPSPGHGGAPRVLYEDHTDSNDAFDRDNELVRLGELQLLPRQVLFHVDLEAYRAALNDFIAAHDRQDDRERPSRRMKSKGGNRMTLTAPTEQPVEDVAPVYFTTPVCIYQTWRGDRRSGRSRRRNASSRAAGRPCYTGSTQPIHMTR